MKNWMRAACVYGGVFLAYTLLTLVMTYPAVTRLNTHLLGNGDDMWVHYWNGWWVRQVLQQGKDLFYTPLLFHPTGVSLRHHNFAWFNIALWLALEPLIGGVAAYNVACLIHIPLCGLAMFALARHLTKSHAIAFAGGLVYAFWPFRMLDLNHPNMISTEGFPILMLLLLHLVQGRKPIWRGVVGGLLVALIGYMRLQLLILAGFIVVLYLFYTLIWERERWSWQTATGLILMAAVAAVLMIPGLYPFIQEGLESELPEEVYEVEPTSVKQDVVSYLAPQHQHPLSSLHDRLFTSYTRTKERYRYSAFLGHIAIGLAIVGLVKRRREKMTWFWLGLAVLCFALALGPVLRFDLAIYTNIPLPYRLIGWLPPIKLLGPPRRFNALLALPVAVLTGYGALALREWLTRRPWGRWLAHPATFTVLLTLLLLLDYFTIPTDTVPAHTPAFYATLAEEPGDFAVVGLPGERRQAEYHMFYQTVHGRPLLSGHVSRLPPQALAFMASVPLLRDLYESGAIDTSPPDVSRQLSLLAQAGFRYVIVHKDFTSPEQLAEWRSYLVASPRYDDEEVVVYSTAPVVGQDCPLSYELGEGIGLIHVSLPTESTRAGDGLRIKAVWGTTTPARTNFRVEIALLDDQGNVRQAQRFEISPDWSTEEWPANTIVRDKFLLQLGSDLEEGTYTVVMGLIRKDDGQPVGRQAEVGEAVVLPPRVFTLPPMDQEIGAAFGDALRLRGYDLDVAAGEAHLTLHWQAQRPMETSYKFFVHLADAASGELAAQADVVPRNWTYPTTEWVAGEVVSDEIVLPLGELPAGNYRLWVGVYHPESGDRLPIHDAPSGSVVDADRLMLPEAITQ